MNELRDPREATPWQPRIVAVLLGAPHVVEKMDAADELHREEPLPVLFEELAQAGQVRVLDVRERAELVLEAEDGVGLDGA